MPVYEFECGACNALITEYMKLSDKPLKKCPECKKNKLVRIISVPAKPFVPGHPLDEIAKMKQEAKQIAKRIVRGDENAIADVYGEDAANGKEPSNAKTSKPKQLKDVKKGKGVIRRSK